MFGKNKFPAVAALAGLTGAAVTVALVDAANDELEAANITGAALISAEAFNSMETSMQATATALQAAGAKDIAELVSQRDQARQQAEEFGNQPGALGTTSAKEKSDVEEEGEKPDWMAIHEKMLG